MSVHSPRCCSHTTCAVVGEGHGRYMPANGKTLLHIAILTSRTLACTYLWQNNPTRMSGLANSVQWRAPFIPGLRTQLRGALLWKGNEISSVSFMLHIHPNHKPSKLPWPYLEGGVYVQRLSYKGDLESCSGTSVRLLRHLPHCRSAPMGWGGVGQSIAFADSCSGIWPTTVTYGSVAHLVYVYNPTELYGLW